MGVVGGRRREGSITCVRGREVPLAAWNADWKPICEYQCVHILKRPIRCNRPQLVIRGTQPLGSNPSDNECAPIPVKYNSVSRRNYIVVIAGSPFRSVSVIFLIFYNLFKLMRLWGSIDGWEWFWLVNLRQHSLFYAPHTGNDNN